MAAEEVCGKCGGPVVERLLSTKRSEDKNIILKNVVCVNMNIGYTTIALLCFVKSSLFQSINLTMLLLLQNGFNQRRYHFDAGYVLHHVLYAKININLLLIGT